MAAAKVLHEFAKGNDKLVIKGGAMPNYVMDAQRRQGARHACRSREELLSKLLGTMQAPIAQFVRTLNEVPTQVRPAPRRGARRRRQQLALAA